MPPVFRLTDVIASGPETPAGPTGLLRADDRVAALAPPSGTLAELGRPGGVAFFRAEVAPDIDERRAALRDCLRRVSERFERMLEAGARRGPTPS